MPSEIFFGDDIWKSEVELQFHEKRFSEGEIYSTKIQTSSRSPPQSNSCKNTQQCTMLGFILHPLLLHKTPDVQTLTSKSLWYGLIIFLLNLIMSTTIIDFKYDMRSIIILTTLQLVIITLWSEECYSSWSVAWSVFSFIGIWQCSIMIFLVNVSVV